MLDKYPFHVLITKSKNWLDNFYGEKKLKKKNRELKEKISSNLIKQRILKDVRRIKNFSEINVNLVLENYNKYRYECYNVSTYKKTYIFQNQKTIRNHLIDNVASFSFIKTI